MTINGATDFEAIPKILSQKTKTIKDVGWVISQDSDLLHFLVGEAQRIASELSGNDTVIPLYSR
jgi:hypothetical protein